MRQEWTVIDGVCRTPGAEGRRVYGVAATLADGSVWRWEDVDTDLAVAYVLACRLQEWQPAPCHFEDLVRDFIAEMAGKV